MTQRVSRRLALYAANLRDERQTALQGLARRYLGSARSYVGFRVVRGSSRGEIRSSTDVEVIDSTDVAVEVAVPVSEKWNVKAEAGRGSGANQHTLVSLQLGRRF